MWGWVGEPDPRARGWTRGACKWLAILACVAGFFAHALYIRHLFLGNACDDAYISFQYLRNLVEHGELAYNLGERVEGYSNLLWILLLAPGYALGVPIDLAAQILGLGLGVVTMLIAVVTVRTQLGAKHFVAQLGVGVLLASSGYYAAWSVMGLESMLHAFLLLGAWLSFMRTGPWSAVFLGALAMTRPEGLLLALGALLVRGIADFWPQPPGMPKARIDWRFYLLLLGILGAFECFRLGYFGLHLWPNAVRAKVGGSAAQVSRGWRYVYSFLLRPYGYLLLSGLAVPWWVLRSPLRSSGFFIFFGYLLFFMAAGGDWSVGRFFAPLMPIGVVLFACALDDLMGDRARAWPRLGLGLVIYGTLGFYSYAQSSQRGEQAFARRFARSDARRIALGRWIAKHTAKNIKVALFAAGQVAFYGKRYAHDMLGLNDRHIASLEPYRFGQGRPGHEKYDVRYTLDEVKPTIIVQPGLIPGMTRHPTFVRDYQVLPPWPEAWVLRSYWTAQRERTAPSTPTEPGRPVNPLWGQM